MIYIGNKDVIMTSVVEEQKAEEKRKAEAEKIQLEAEAKKKTDEAAKVEEYAKE